MKLETTIISAKAACVVVRGCCVTLAAGFAQWATGGEEPGKIAVLVIIATTLAAGASELSSFLSTSFSKYMQNGAGQTAPPVDTAPPKP